jgi:excinuclease UvrABC nuclease subunit
MTNLVDAYLERIPADVFVRFQEAIKDLASKRHGVYALYKGDKLYYVGLAKNLKSRVQQHLKDQHKREWDMFSLYLI